MPQKSDMPPERFEELLAWLNSDRELAGRVYEEIRRDLIRIFGWNRCTDPEGMADETFDRAEKKASHLRDTFQGNPKLFFYRVANNLIKEHQKKAKSYVPIEEVELAGNAPPELDEETTDLREECLHDCLRRLSPDKRDLIVTYYAKEKQAKINHRSDIARQLGVSIETLRVRMCRIRHTLEECIERCLDQLKARNETD